MFRTGVRAILVSGTLFVLSGCATVVHGRTQRLTVVTIPAGAHISIAGMERGISPAVVSVHRKDVGQVMKIAAPGYETEEIVMQRHISKWIATDVLWGASQFLNQGISSSKSRTTAALAISGTTLGIDILTGAAFSQKSGATAPIVLRPTIQP